MILFRFRYHVAGGHTHVRVFAGILMGGVVAESATLGKCGDLCFRNEEWQAFMLTCKHYNVMFIEDQT